jgi:hypothetical protein
MPRTEERDPESFAHVLSAFDGARYSLDTPSSEVLRLMLERNEGCDGTISADRFELRFGRHPARHRYDLRAAPAAIARLLELADAAPGARSLVALIGPVEARGWSCGTRRVWLHASAAEVTVQVRSAEAGGPDELPPPLPDSLMD